MSNASRRHDSECGVRHGTWTYPSSFGGLIGATLAAARPGAVHVTAVLGKVVLPALVSPLLAGVVAPDGGDRRCTRILDRDHRHCRGLGRRARWRVEHTRAHEGTLRLAVGPRLHPQWTSEAHALSLSVATVIRHPGRCPAERQSWLSRHLVQNQSSSRRTAADEAGWRMRPAVIIAWTPPRVSSTSGSCGPILTAPSRWCAPVTALDGSDVTSGWGVAAHR